MGLLLNRAKENTATTGTGAVTPSSAVVPYRSWSASGAVAGNWYDYLIEDGAGWEIGVGLYNGATITRPGPGVDPWFDSSSGALLNLSGSATIACVANQHTLAAEGVFMPPLASSFTLASGDATQLTLTDDVDVGLLVYSGTAVGGPLQRIGYRTLTTPTGDWTMIARMRGHIRKENYRGFGIYAMDSVGGRLISMQANFSLETPASLRAEHFPGISGGNTDVFAFSVQPVFEWVKLAKSGANITYSSSSDGKIWYDWATESATAYMANVPNRVGIGVWEFGTSATVKYSVPYFSLTGTAV